MISPLHTLTVSALAAVCSAELAEVNKPNPALPCVPEPQRFEDAGQEYWAAYRALHRVIESSDRQALAQLLTAGADRALALFIAIDLQKLDIAEHLLWQGNCVAGKPYARCTVLYALCGCPRFGECGGSSWGDTPISVTPYPDQHKLVALALANGADVNEGSGYYRNTPLMQAARSGDTATVELLLQAGADVNRRNAGGMTALSWAACANHPEVVKLLLAAGALVNIPTTCCGATPNGWCRTGCTELHIAALHGSAECISLLLAAGADIEARDMFGRTPFILSPLSGNTATVRALIDGGADINACYKSSTFDKEPTPGYNALHQLDNRYRPGDSRGEEMRQFLLNAGVKNAAL